MRNTIIVSCALALLACSSSPAPAPAAPGRAAGPAPTEPAPAAGGQTAAPDIGEGIPWDDKTHEQKAAFMKLEVVPAVAAIWRESPEPEEEVTCATCHGAGAKEGDFDMPNAELPALDPSDGFAAHKDEAAWLEFMGAKLVPTMAETLGVAPYDPSTHEGFGCFACHPMAGK